MQSAGGSSGTPMTGICSSRSRLRAVYAPQQFAPQQQFAAPPQQFASPAAFSTQVVELPQQMPVIPVCPPTEPYVLPGDPNAPVMIDNQLALPPPVAQTDSLVSFLHRALGAPVQFYDTFIPRNGKSSTGMNEVVSSLTIPVPFPGQKFGLLISPSEQVRFLDGPVAPQLPSRLIDLNLAVNLVGEIGNNFVIDAGAVPGYHSMGDDNANGDSSRNGAIRVPYFGLVGYRFSPTFLFAAGRGRPGTPRRRAGFPWRA